jgi:hypothetical protein
VQEVIRRIVASANSPQAVEDLSLAFLPLLMDYVAPLLQNPTIFARFRYALELHWKAMLPGIPLPDTEGVYNYETAMQKLGEYLMQYSNKIVAMHRSGIVPAYDVRNLVNRVAGLILFKAVIDVLRFVGEV